ncbi:MAG: hypothetical protein QNJ17_03960 [Desulfocapsaceae bacterium]|nr:hypothetical protein [Desulfocapsaceae bacterium]
MSTSHRFTNCTISLRKKGSDRYIKISYPQRFGCYSEIETPKALYQFNLNGEIKFIRYKGERWLDPQEWLKRTLGNDWVYYSTGGYTGVFEAIGEYYLPNLQYPTNSLIGGKPFAHPSIRQAINTWHDDLVEIRRETGDAPADIREFLDQVVTNNPVVLAEKARRLFNISGGRVSVLPPDARHCDYDILPLNIASGCLYKCRFCKVKNTTPFSEKEPADIDDQLQSLRDLCGEDLANYNSVFLGDHDALLCSSKLLLYGVTSAYERLALYSSFMRGVQFFLFGSVDSFLSAEDTLFEELQRIPADFYINIGLESADQQTLEILGKPLKAVQVEEAFKKIQMINDRYTNIEVTANFLMDRKLPANHYRQLHRLLGETIPRKKPKGSVYLSPLKFDSPSRELVFEFNHLKLQSRLPTFLYIIQRL